MKPNHYEKDRQHPTLPSLKIKAPADFTERVMAGLPPPSPIRQPRFRLSWSWPQGQWLAPALAGAVAALLVVSTLHLLPIPTRTPAQTDTLVRISFELHAPDANSVALAGSFNAWAPGQIQLTGPDRTGLWHTEISLPEGVYEYSFIVNGNEWIADPRALAYRDDGFGSRNSLITL
ncbi:MAG TPA: hypothetical protein DCS43_15550 [Verrucomicrobia bacterium]|nr:hypothetical protein [Verrucomicrobiota bacterium]